MHKANSIQERFSSVAGNQEAKDALSDIITYLKNPELYQKLGAQPPKGVLLVGDPGTGKTLLARALAREANCSFITTTGSSFAKMFIGVGSARVKHLFNTVKSQKKYFWSQPNPCIIFIDEIDALAQARNKNIFHNEDDKTLNELLTNMDGFATNSAPIIIIGATNNIESLDPAILRPGRFDRIISTSLPTATDRVSILNVHLKKINYSVDLDVQQIAEATPGFSGAELENLVNQAAIIAVKKAIPEVTIIEFEEAKDKLTIGAPNKSMTLSYQDRKITAYHEGWSCTDQPSHSNSTTNITKSHDLTSCSSVRHYSFST